MRVLLVDDTNRILLFRDSDPGLTPVPHWWITPGGGVDRGETDRAAAVREIGEETGLVVAAADLVGPIATRRVVHGYSDVVTTQDEAFWFLAVEAFEVSTDGHTELERLTMTAHRWWTREDLGASAEQIWPADLPYLWEVAEDLVTGRRSPHDAPLDLGVVEESTVPA